MNMYMDVRVVRLIGDSCSRLSSFSLLFNGLDGCTGKNIEDDLENYRSFVRTVYSYYLYLLRACFRMVRPNVLPRTFSF